MTLPILSALIVSIISGSSAQAAVLTVESIPEAAKVAAPSAAVAVRPIRCNLYLNGVFFDTEVLYPGYRATGYVWLSNVRVNVLASFSNRTVIVSLKDTFFTTSRAISRIPANISTTDIQVDHFVYTNSGQESVGVRCFSI